MEMFFSLPLDTREFRFGIEGELDLYHFTLLFTHSDIIRFHRVFARGEYREDGRPEYGEWRYDENESDSRTNLENRYIMFEDVDGKEMKILIDLTQTHYLVKMTIE